MSNEMKQTLLIGLGGTGSRVVNNVAKELRSKNISINDGFVTCAVLDTNKSDNSLIEKTGTAIPVIPTSKAMKIDDYLAEYENENPLAWCPYDTNFGQQSMLAGASEMRFKSRIAFMDTIKSGDILQLEKVLNSIFSKRGDDQVRVMLVSSLAGGTGSGMFIQTALWLRKFFKERNCPSMIRGIFLLPDIFVRTVDNIRSNSEKKLSLYANAYAAIRELNGINKIIRDHDYKPSNPIVIDELFNSENPGAEPVFDYAFFVDDIDQRGVSFTTSGEYEKLAAQMVFMQLYAPMVDEMVSVEDNLYRVMHASKDPLFGSCGASKAIYPKEDVIEYCALRATKESLAEGWNGIDGEIDAIVEEEKQAELDGRDVDKKVSRRDMFVKLFDEKSNKKGDEIGKGDRIFVKIRKDAYNEIREMGEDGNAVSVLTPKIDAFIEILTAKIEEIVAEAGGCEKVQRIVSGLPKSGLAADAAEIEVDMLKGLRDKEVKAVEIVLKEFDEKAKDFADEIIRSIIPSDMGAVKATNESSVYGMLVKKEPEGDAHFVHPIVAKYLVYRLLQEIEKLQSGLMVDRSRDKAMKGDDKISFDNEKTRQTETREEYWKQVAFLGISAAEKAHFIKKYIAYNTENTLLCQQYETQLLTQLVLQDLHKYVTELSKQMEALFETFGDVVTAIDKEIEKNIERNVPKTSKTLYVNAKEIHKANKYASLRFDVSGYNADLNKSVIDTVYGKFCLKFRPNDDDNKVYADVSIGESLKEGMKDSFSKMFVKDSSDAFNISIYKAVAEESDIDTYAEKGKDFVESASDKIIRYSKAFNEYVTNLEYMAAPCLRAKPEFEFSGENANAGTDIQMTNGKNFRTRRRTELQFWGYNPALGKEFDGLEEALGANLDTSASEDYGINELMCYRSVYGIKTEAIEKFNEMSANGEYYKMYEIAIDRLLKGDELATPHLDKTWHEILPYVSSKKQGSTDANFYCAFWQALAYDYIDLDEKGRYRIKRTVVNVLGKESTKWETMSYNGKEIGMTDIATLIAALKSDTNFEKDTVPRVTAAFEEDLANIKTYVGTKFMKGLSRNKELNPVTMIVRYATSRGSDGNLVVDLIDTLSVVIRKLPENYNMVRDDASIDAAMYRLCYKLYNDSDRTKDKAQVFGDWVKVFNDVENVENFEEETEE